MAIILGGITLPDFIWENDLTWTGVEARVQKTLGGRVLVWEQTVAGRPIDLVGGSHWGWMTGSTLKALQGLAATPNALAVLNYEGSLHTVRFRHEDTAIQADPILPRPNHADQDYYHNVRIRLMEMDTAASSTTTTT